MGEERRREMIVYLAARIVARLYGLGWPLESNVRVAFALLSAFEILIVAIILTFEARDAIFGKDDEEESNDDVEIP